jgi:mono/diheme cytochrome c family protein
VERAHERRRALEPPPRSIRNEPTAEYGRYLAHDVANCVGCHTQRDLRTGAFTGPALGGGMVIESHGAPKQRFVTPNLTPDPATGRIIRWSEDAFVQRFRGAQASPSPMPWSSFARMSESDLRALYRYLRSVPPARMPEES